jgi:hypothetical protein
MSTLMMRVPDQIARSVVNVEQHTRPLTFVFGTAAILMPLLVVVEAGCSLAAALRVCRQGEPV